MQLCKFYGRTIGGTLARVRRQLGPDALILETRTLEADCAAARMNPGARYEITAVREAHGAVMAAAPAATAARRGERGRRPAMETPIADPPEAAAAPAAPRVWSSHSAQTSPAVPRPAAVPPATSHNVLEDLGLLRRQLRQLLEEPAAEGDPAAAAAQGIDLRDYHDLIALGVDHRVLSPHFRRWLNWRTASPALRHYLAHSQGGPAARMEGESLREWLWLAWLEGQSEAEAIGAACQSGGALGRPHMVGLVGPTGGGKTTSLAKLSSIIRHEKRQNPVIVTLDAQRFGATEQWRKLARLMGIEIQEAVTQEDVRACMETWDRFDWVGIDTPGGMPPDSPVGRLYGSIVAQCPDLNTLLVMPTTQHESAAASAMRRARDFGARGIVFTKLDETERHGGIVNLTMDGTWNIAGFATGQRVPQDWVPASSATLWEQVLAPAAAGDAALGAHRLTGGVRA
ncbi:MAG TPA: hypothetical protein PK847_03080 [Candidatus Sumerlaeota bacterium]|nr:hypothetical protein [Candidatus Sumerlaeota bacterium]